MARSELDVIRWLRNHLTSQHGAMHTTLHDRQLVVQNLAHAAVLVDFRVEDEEFVRGEATAARCNSAHVRLFLFQIRNRNYRSLIVRKSVQKDVFRRICGIIEVVLAVVLALELLSFLLRNERR